MCAQYIVSKHRVGREGREGRKGREGRLVDRVDRNCRKLADCKINETKT